MALSLAKLHVALDAAQQIDIYLSWILSWIQTREFVDIDIHLLIKVYSWKISGQTSSCEYWILNAHQTKSSSTGTHYCCEQNSNRLTTRYCIQIPVSFKKMIRVISPARSMLISGNVKTTGRRNMIPLRNPIGIAHAIAWGTCRTGSRTSSHMLATIAGHSHVNAPFHIHIW